MSCHELTYSKHEWFRLRLDNSDACPGSKHTRRTWDSSVSRARLSSYVWMVLLYGIQLQAGGGGGGGPPCVWPNIRAGGGGGPPKRETLAFRLRAEIRSLPRCHSIYPSLLVTYLPCAHIKKKVHSQKGPGFVRTPSNPPCVRPWHQDPR